MDDHTHQHDAHGHGGRLHVHASVDHLASGSGPSARLAIRLDSALMEALGVNADAILRVATERGRSILVRLDAPLDADRGTDVVRLDRFVRQALKAHLNETVEIEPADVGKAERIELNPAVDVSMAHDLVPHIKTHWLRTAHPQHRCRSVRAVSQIACGHDLRGPSGFGWTGHCR